MSIKVNLKGNRTTKKKVTFLARRGDNYHYWNWSSVPVTIHTGYAPSGKLRKAITDFSYKAWLSNFNIPIKKGTIKQVTFTVESITEAPDPPKDPYQLDKILGLKRPKKK